jgi:hypothetical protein
MGGDGRVVEVWIVTPKLEAGRPPLISISLGGDRNISVLHGSGHKGGFKTYAVVYVTRSSVSRIEAIVSGFHQLLDSLKRVIRH